MSKRLTDPRKIVGFLSTVVFASIVLSSAHGEDTVIVSRTGGRGQTQRKGQVLDYTGSGLTLQLSNGHKEQIPADRVIRIETSLVPDHENADSLQTEGRFANALASYRRAMDEEPRVWMRRRILAQMVKCHQNLGQVAMAGNTFLIIVRSDPTTPLFDTIPLPWKPQRVSAEIARQASDWMADRDVPAAVLLGASWLLSTPRREEARVALQKLSSNPDTRVALLAEAQRWRSQIVTVSDEQIGRWRDQVTRFDKSMRAGPYFVIGQALAQRRIHAQAALTLLRVPILYPSHRDLAAEALMAAGEQLEHAGQRNEAQIVYRELIETYGQHPLAPLAQTRLDNLSQGK